MDLLHAWASARDVRQRKLGIRQMSRAFGDLRETPRVGCAGWLHGFGRLCGFGRRCKCGIGKRSRSGVAHGRPAGTRESGGGRRSGAEMEAGVDTHGLR